MVNIHIRKYLLCKYLLYEIFTNLILFPMVLVLYVCVPNITTNVSNLLGLHQKTRNNNGYATSEWPFKSSQKTYTSNGTIKHFISCYRHLQEIYLNTFVTQNYVFVVFSMHSYSNITLKSYLYLDMFNTPKRFVY